MRVDQVISDFIKKSILTTQGDLLQRGASIPERMALGAPGEMIISNGTIALWYNIWTGMTEGDLIVFSSGAPAWLNPGATGEFLGGNGALTLPSWQNPFAFLTTQGDVVYRDGSGKQRLAIGTAAQVLKVNSGATAPEWATNNTIVEQGAGAGTLYPMIWQIGDWDMDANTLKSVAHGLGSEWKNWRSWDVVIRNDGDTGYYPLDRREGSGQSGGLLGVTDTNIELARDAGGFFDDTGFDSTSYNRGWVIIWFTS